jgi:hypothetical protein
MLVFCNSREMPKTSPDTSQYCEARNEPTLPYPHGNLSPAIREGAADLMRDDTALSPPSPRPRLSWASPSDAGARFQIDAPFTVTSFLLAWEERGAVFTGQRCVCHALGRSPNRGASARDHTLETLQGLLWCSSILRSAGGATALTAPLQPALNTPTIGNTLQAVGS